MSAFVVTVGVLFSLCAGCGVKESAKAPKTLTVTFQSAATPLYFSGIIEPIKTYNLSAPVEGVVAEMHFHYGENIAKAYATGIEMRLYGELVKDAESWISIGLMANLVNVGKIGRGSGRR